MDLPFAETVNYWKSGQSSLGAILDKAHSIIERLGGIVTMKAEGIENGRAAFLLDFYFADERFRCIWPVLPTRKGGNELAAKRQAATLLFHDIKAKSLKCSIFGPRVAFFEYILLENGQTIVQMNNYELIEYLPKQLKSG